VRLLIYKLLTQGIIWLGLLRDKVQMGLWLEKREDRTFDLYHNECWICCDCGAIHYSIYFGPEHDCGHEPLHKRMTIVGHTWPMRPKGYDYSLRRGAGKPSLAGSGNAPRD